MPTININQNIELTQPIVLKSRDIVNGNGFVIRPATGYVGPAFLSENANYVKVENCSIRGFQTGIKATTNNYLTINDCDFSDCYNGLLLDGNWDCVFRSLHIIRPTYGIVLSGNSRPSNPLNFFDVHLESYKENAVLINEKVFNLQFYGCKFHANIGTVINNWSIATPINCPPMTFFGGQFMFNPYGHFNNKSKPKCRLISPITDNRSNLGNVIADNPIINERRENGRG